MADRNAATTSSNSNSSAVAKPIWMKQAAEAKLKSEAEKTAAAKAAFDATFKALSSRPENPSSAASDSDSDEGEELDEQDRLASKPVGPVDPAKCSAAGAGIAGGTACAAATFVVVTKDADGRKVPHGGAQIKVKVAPGLGVGGTEQEGIVKDTGDGTYTVTYVVPKRGNYMVTIECNGKPIMGSPFPVFFSAGMTTGGLLGMAPVSTYPNLVNQTMPNMPNYLGSVSGTFPGIGMIPGIVAGPSGGAILPGMGASLGEVCREYLNGRCAKTDCKLNHPPHNLLMAALAATTGMGTVSQVPMAPSAAAMAAAQAIVAAQALQAHAAQMQAQAQSSKDSSGSAEKQGKDDALKKTVQVSNLSPLLTVEQLKQLFGFCGQVIDCSITDSKHFAFIEYSKPEEATAALQLNNIDVAGRPINVEMAKSLPSKPVLNSSMASSSLPMIMQQAVAMQQMQFQQALLMQQNMTAQQAANRAATMKSATELAAARAAEISKKLKADGLVDEENETKEKSRSPSPSRAKSRSKSRSPVAYHRRQRSPSYSPPSRFRRTRISRSPVRSRYYSRYESEKRSYRDSRDDSGRSRRWNSDRSYGHHSPVSRRNRSRSVSPRTRKSHRGDPVSPKRRRESSPHRAKLSSRGRSTSPRHHRGSKSSPRNDTDDKLSCRRRSRSKSVENSSERTNAVQDGKSRKYEERRSRSSSAEGKRHGRRLSPRSSNGKDSKHRRRSRSKSLDAKHQSDENMDGTRYEKLKHSGRKRSRSKSVEGHRSREKQSESKDIKSRHRDRRRYRSTSAEHKHHRRSRSPRRRDENKSKHRRRSRSISSDGKHHNSRRIGETKHEKSKNRNRKHSGSAEGKLLRSPQNSEETKSKHKAHSRSRSVEERHHSTSENDMKSDGSPRDHDHGLERTGDSNEEMDFLGKDSANMRDAGVMASKYENFDSSNSLQNMPVNGIQHPGRGPVPIVNGEEEVLLPKSDHPFST